MPQTKQLKLHAEIGAVVSTAYRYSTAQKTKFDSRIDDERHTHMSEPSHSPDGTAYSFRESDDTELLIVLRDGPPNDFNVRIDYVHAGELDDAGFDTLYKFLLKTGLEEVEAPSMSPPGPSDKPETWRAVLGFRDVHGALQLRGVIVNPPYPWAPGPRRSKVRPPGRGLVGLLGALIAGATVATLVRGRQR